MIDFYTGDLPHPVRVDFSENIASLYLFNVLSQVTLKKINHVSFVVSLGGTNKTSLSPLLVGLDTLYYSSGSLVWNKNSSFLDISTCYYEDYRNFNGSLFEDPSLLSMIQNNSYDQIYDEHPHIFSILFINEITSRGFFHQCTDKDKLTNNLSRKYTQTTP